MTIIGLRLDTGCVQLCLLDQSITLNWSGRQNLFGRHIHIQTHAGLLILSQFGFAVYSRESGVTPPAYRALTITGRMRDLVKGEKLDV